MTEVRVEEDAMIVLDAMSEPGIVYKRTALAQATRLSPGRVTRACLHLRKEGKVVMRGSRRGSAWVLAQSCGQPQMPEATVAEANVEPAPEPEPSAAPVIQ